MREKEREREREREREGESLIYLYDYVYPLVEATKCGYTSPSDAMLRRFAVRAIEFSCAVDGPTIDTCENDGIELATVRVARIPPPPSHTAHFIRGTS